MKQQVLIIHGGDSFEKYEDYLHFLKNFEINLEKFSKNDWKDNLQKDLGKKFGVIYPQMPNKLNANYIEWKIWFEKILNLLEDNLILIGHSLGGIFLAKYLSEDDISKKIKAVILVSAPFDEKGSFKLSKLVLNLNNYKKIFLIHSKDDQVVSYGEVKKYKKILTKAKVITFEDRGHFNQEEFSEIVELTKKI